MLMIDDGEDDVTLMMNGSHPMCATLASDVCYTASLSCLSITPMTLYHRRSTLFRFLADVQSPIGVGAASSVSRLSKAESGGGWSLLRQ